MSQLKDFIDQTIELCRSKTLRSVSVVLSANTVHAGLGFLITIIALRGLDSVAIGILFPLISMTLMIKQFGDFGLNTAFIKSGSSNLTIDPLRAREIFSNYFYLKFFSGLVVAVLGLFFARSISSLLFDNDIHVHWVRWAFGLGLFQFVSTYFQSSLQITKNFKQLGISKVLPQAIKLAGLSYLLYFATLDLNNAFFFYMGIPVFVFLCSLNRSNIAPLGGLPVLKHSGALFSVGKWVWISMAANAGIAHLDILMTRSMAGSEEVARLIAGQRLASVIPIVTGSLVLVLLPKVSSMASLKELNYFARKTLTYAPLLSIATLSLIPLSSLLTTFLLGESYESSSIIFNIYLIANALGLILTPLGLILYRLDKESTLAVLALTQLVFNVIGNYLYIPLYGAEASATVTLGCKLIALVFFIPILIRSGVFGREN